MSGVNQQDTVYAAQAQSQSGRSFTALDAVHAYVDELINQPWWIERFPSVESVDVDHIRRPSRWAGLSRYDRECRCGVIDVALPTLERTILHELAHVCAEAEVGDAVGHGPYFVRTFLELTFRARGTDAWQDLRAAMILGGVSIG